MTHLADEIDELKTQINASHVNTANIFAGVDPDTGEIHVASNLRTLQFQFLHVFTEGRTILLRHERVTKEHLAEMTVDVGPRQTALDWMIHATINMVLRSWICGTYAKTADND